MKTQTPKRTKQRVAYGREERGKILREPFAIKVRCGGSPGDWDDDFQALLSAFQTRIRHNEPHCKYSSESIERR